MSDRLLLSTRKGLFEFRRDGAGWARLAVHFLGDNVSYTLVDPRDGSWYAALNLGHFGCKLHRSTDQGASWTEIAVPAYAADDMVSTGDGKQAQPAALKLLWTLAAGADDQPGRLWAGTIPGGLFRSDDHGTHWSLVRSLWDCPQRQRWFGGGFDWPGIHSICVDPRDSSVLRVAVSCGGVWRGDDDGQTWTLSARGMRAAYMPPDLSADEAIQDPHCMVQCSAAPDTLWVQHHNGVFRSRDGGSSWQELQVAPSSFGFAVAVHPTDPQTAWFIPAVKDECRVPVDGQLCVTRTRDGGDSFEQLRLGLPQADAYDLILRHALAIDATGRSLAFASTTGNCWFSDNQGDQWVQLNAHLPPVSAVCFC